MELSLLRRHDVVLGREGIPLNLAHPLVKGSRYHDENLRHGFGSDPVRDEINRRERLLGELTAEQIELRIAADFCCIWRYDYPERVRQICALIGGRPARGLRLHYQICPERRRLLVEYAASLDGWLREKAIEAYDAAARPTAEKIYAFLGGKEPVKALLVERTLIGLSMRALNCSFWGRDSFSDRTPLLPFHASDLKPDAPRRMAKLEREILGEMGSAGNNFLCDVGGSAEPACHFKFIRRIDILLSSIGCLRWRGNLPAKDAAVSGRRRITQTVLTVLAAYWNGEQQRLDDEAEALRAELFELLGEPDDLKRWLVASLWKNISDQTTCHAYPLRHWAEFVRIGEQYVDRLEHERSAG